MGMMLSISIALCTCGGKAAVSVWILTSLFRPAASLYTEISRLVYVDDETNVLCLIKETRRGMAGVKVQYHTFV